MLVQSFGPSDAKIMIVGDFPSLDDMRSHTACTNPELNRMLMDAGIMKSQCFVTSALRVQPPGDDLSTFIPEKKRDIVPGKHMEVDGKWVMPIIYEHRKLLAAEIATVQPNVIIALGNLAMWALTGKWGITSWRSSILTCTLDLPMQREVKVIPTFAPVMVQKQHSWRPIMVHDLRKAKAESETPSIIRPEYQFLVRPDFDTACHVLSELIGFVEKIEVKLAVDIETRAGHIACIGIAWSDVNAICIPLMSAADKAGYWKEGEEFAILNLIQRLLTHKNAVVIGQNFSYDAQYFWRWLLYIPNLRRDTMISQHVCFSNMQKSLDFLSSMYCKYHVYWKDEGKEWDEKTGEDQLWTYNCKDCVVTFEVDTVEQANVDAMGLREPHDFQQKLFWPVLRSMNRGVRIDEARRAAFAQQLMDSMLETKFKIDQMVGWDLNPRSGPQMAELFYNQLGQKPVFSRKTFRPSFDDECLLKMRDRERLLAPLIKLILRYRSLGVYFSTFIQAPLDIDGRMRCSYNIAGTETYRFSSSKNAFGSGMNMQNVTAGDEDDGLPNVKTMFIPDEGMEFFDIDLSSADLRIVVWEADEPEMKAMLKAGLDPYTEIAKEFYHDPSITKKDPRRQLFKSFAHGTNYLGTAKGLAERLGLGVHEAESTQKWYFGRFKRIKAWQLDLIDQVTKRKMVENRFGYRTYFFDRIEGTIFNQAAAWIPQSSVACIINRAYEIIDREMPDLVQVLMQVHDSLAGQYPIHRRDEAKARILKAAEIPIPYDDPLVIPVGIKTSMASWGDCK